MPKVHVQRKSLEEEEEQEIPTKSLLGKITPLIRRQEIPEEELQSKEQSGQMPQVTSNLESRISNIKSGGQPLDPVTRAFFELRFGHDFSKVRVHAHGAAADTAKSINARAFTLGNHVAMGSSEYQPQ